MGHRKVHDGFMVLRGEDWGHKGRYIFIAQVLNNEVLLPFWTGHPTARNSCTAPVNSGLPHRPWSWTTASDPRLPPRGPSDSPVLISQVGTRRQGAGRELEAKSSCQLGFQRTEILAGHRGGDGEGRRGLAWAVGVAQSTQFLGHWSWGIPRCPESCLPGE